MALCEKFHLSPFDIRKQRLSEFCVLVKRLNKYEKKKQEKPKTKDGKEQNFIPVMDYKKGGGG